MRRAVLWGCAAGALALVWPAMAVVHAGGQPSVLIGTGAKGPSLQLLEREVPDLVGYGNAGHDGQQFYAVARHPFEPELSAPDLANPAYRYRRIGFSFLGWVLAPHGGLRLILALAGIGVASVAAAGALLSRFPGAPRWLPLTAAVSPGVAASLLLTLADALVLALILGALAAGWHRRWPVVVGLLVAAVLTRETAMLATIALALTPGMPLRWRAATVALPGIALAGWSLWTAHALGVAVSDGSPNQLAFPLSGWLHSSDSAEGLFLGLLLMVVTFLGAVRATWPPVRWYLGLTGVLMLVLADAVTASWVNTSRVAIATLPLAAWAITTSPEHARA
jgi:hypothetical protein